MPNRRQFLQSALSVGAVTTVGAFETPSALEIAAWAADAPIKNVAWVMTNAQG